MFQAAGGLQSELGVAKLVVDNGADPLKEAESCAERGILGGAMAYVLASDLDPVEKIEKANDIAIVVSDYFADKTDLTELDRTLRSRAVAVMQTSREFMERQGNSQ